jgi:hypothetical protein
LGNCNRLAIARKIALMMTFGKLVIELDSSGGETPWNPSLIMTRQLELTPYHVLLLEEELLDADGVD